MIWAMMKFPREARCLVARHAHINWTLADQVVVSGANFLTAIIIARFLGLEAFGIFSLAWLIVLFAQSFQMAFILSPMLSIGPKQGTEDAPDYYESLIILQAGFAFLSSGLTACIAVLAGTRLGMGEAGGTLALPLAFTVVMTQMHEFFRRTCFARGRPTASLLMDVIRYGGQIVVLLVLFLGNIGSVKAALLTLAASAVPGAVCLFFDFSKPTWKSQQIVRTLHRHWGIAKWLLPSALMQWTSGNFFTLAAGALLGPSAVGAMRAAQNLMGITHVGFEALNNWAPVRAARIYTEGGDAGLRTFTRRLMLFTGGGTLIAVLALALPAKLWLTLFYGEAFSAYGWLVAAYGASYLLMSLATPYRHAFTAMEHTRPVFIGYLAATAFSLAAVYPLIDMFDLSGAMAGIVGVQIVMSGFLIGCFRKRACP